LIEQGREEALGAAKEAFANYRNEVESNFLYYGECIYIEESIALIDQLLKGVIAEGVVEEQAAAYKGKKDFYPFPIYIQLTELAGLERRVSLNKNYDWDGLC